jgi:putative hemolysin
MISLVTTFVLLLFGEIIPKIFSTKMSLKISLFISRPLYFLGYLLWPVLIIFEFITQFINSFLGNKDQKVSKDDIEIFIQQ